MPINAAGRMIPSTLQQDTFIPFGGAHKYQYTSKITELETALQKCGLKNGDTLSFHHQLRNGDYVVNQTIATVHNLGVKNLRIAQTAFFNVHEPIIEYIKNGVITRIEGSINGTVGDYISNNPLPFPVILRSHGGRWSAVKRDELHINIAIIAASTADERGNATGVIGANAFGPISYSQIDAMHADHVIIVTDTISDYPLRFQDIQERYVDYVAHVDKIGDPKNIMSGTTKITEDPMKLQIAHDCVDLMDAAGIIKDGMIFQSGAGGISLAAMKFLDERLEEKNVVASTATGGLTKLICDIYQAGRVKNIYYSQVFDEYSVKFIQNDLGLPADIGHYADPTSKGRTIDGLDTVVLGATEVDTSFNVNVNTHSDGRMLHGIGGHQDTAAGSSLCIITCPVYRKENPIVREHVTTISTPGDVVDAIVTNEGIAINPNRQDLLKKVKGNINLTSIETLKNRAYEATGRPKELELTDTIVGMTKWFDGTVLDVIRQVKR
ncbi:MAG: citrate lyase subunit alpha [Candidatus Thermoplasmatota archaeon]|nr:citrate lyase subunit alpha [Candidatus Thermoplasmatota archaeon]MBU1940691.1 citrate lyase subunit alpha [Candidatus Thermoplasmatota archaeon]